MKSIKAKQFDPGGMNFLVVHTDSQFMKVKCLTVIN